MKAFLKLAALALVVASSVNAYELRRNDSSDDGKVAVIDEKTHDVMDSEFWSTSEASLESGLSSDEMEDNDGALSSSDELDDESWDYNPDEMDELDASANGLRYMVYFEQGGGAKVKEVLGQSRMGELGYVGSAISFATFTFKRGVSQQKAVKYLKGLKRRGVITGFGKDQKVSRHRAGKRCKFLDGSRRSNDCNRETQYCHLETGCARRRGVQTGKCRNKKRGRGELDIKVQVCGCNGKTYGSPAQAREAGVNTKRCRQEGELDGFIGAMDEILGRDTSKDSYLEDEDEDENVDFLAEDEVWQQVQVQV